MGRARVVKEKVLAENNTGLIRSKLIAQENALGLFSVRERRAILIEAAQHMGEFWLAVFLPKRYQMDYAVQQLGYQVKANYKEQKALLFVTPEPLVWRGDLMESSNQASNIGRTGPKGPSVTIRIPTPQHRLAPSVTKVLNTVPEGEIRMLASEFEKALVSFIKGADVKKSGRKRLTPPQRLRANLTTKRNSHTYILT